MAAINEIAESIGTFSLNYKDTGLFGVYALAKVCKIWLLVDVMDIET